MQLCRRSIAVAVLLLSSVLAGCHVQLIMDYDSVVDQELVTVQQSTEEFLGQLEADAGTSKASYDSTRDFYVKAGAALRTIRTRVQYEPKSTEVLTQIDALSKSLNDLQLIQKGAGAGGLNTREIELARAPLETQFAAIAQLQVALKSKLGRKSANALAPALK